MRSMSRAAVVLGEVLVSAFTFHEIRAYGQPSNDFPNPYKIENFGQLPGARKMGQIYGIDIDRDGRSVWVFERCGAATCDGSNVPPLLKFDSSGRLVASFGDRDGVVYLAKTGAGGLYRYTKTNGSNTTR